MSQSVSVIIPTLNASSYIKDLLCAIQNQNHDALQEVLVIDSSSDDNTVEQARAFPFVRTEIIPRKEFSHGGTRNHGARIAKGDHVVFLSQDATPANPSWLTGLTSALETDGVAAAYSRQIPRQDAPPMEKFFLQVHFSEKEKLLAARESGNLGLHDVFFSNVSSAMRKDILLKHPFHEDIIMSEDQQLSRDLLQAGYKIRYTPQSIVLHSHRYSLKSAFQRYFDSAYSLSCILNQTASDSIRIGAGFIPRECWFILTRHPLWLPYYTLYLAAKTAGSLTGHLAPHLPLNLAKALSLHKSHWDRQAQK